MTVFLSSYTNSVDKKGRVSIPAPFRAEIATHSRPQIVVYAAPDGAYLTAWGYDDFLQLAHTIQKMPPLSGARQRLARTLLAAARPLSADETGRILLPENFLSHANISEGATFAGQGDTFTIWNPAAYNGQHAEDIGNYEADIALLNEHWGG